MRIHPLHAALLAALLLAPVACDSDTAADDHCSGLQEAECSALTDCRAVRGVPKGSEDQYAGCVPDSGCEPTRRALAKVGTGACWAFATSCVPAGWEASDSCRRAASGCKGLDKPACDADPWCAALTGSPAGGPSAYAGCWTALGDELSAATCAGVVTTCRHPQTDVLWTFSSGCIPDAWDQSACTP